MSTTRWLRSWSKARQYTRPLQKLALMDRVHAYGGAEVAEWMVGLRARRADPARCARPDKRDERHLPAPPRRGGRLQLSELPTQHLVWSERDYRAVLVNASPACEASHSLTIRSSTHAHGTPTAT